MVRKLNHFWVALSLVLPSLGLLPTSPVQATQPPPNAETLRIDTYLYSVSSWISANGLLPWDRRVTGYLIKDKAGIRESPGSFFSPIYFKRTEANCWQIAAVNQYGSGPWSNEVCYSPPLPKTPSLFLYTSLLRVESLYTSYEFGELAVSKFLVRDNFGISEQLGSFFRAIYPDTKKSNCWEIAAVNAVGQSDWSNKVCYNVPIPQISPSFYTWQKNVSCAQSVVQLRWAYTSLWNSIVDDIVIIDDQGNGYSVSPTVTSATIRDVDCMTPRSYSIGFRNTSGVGPLVNLGAFDPPIVQPSPQSVLQPSVSGLPEGRIGALCADYSVVATIAKSACAKRGGRLQWIFPSSTGSLTASLGSDCVGICYGVPSKINGLPRNTYVSGYFRSDGTYVKPYTRSK
jgi:hypothetical protein